ncbi:hypothetical protein ADUPG1_002234, partial [Aduncisulcus paluster]
WIQNTKSAKVERWRTYLSDFEFELEYVPGKKNIVADTLSRIGHREVSLQPGEVIKELSNSEADAEILEWRPAHVEARGTPLVGDYPQVPVRDFFEEKKASDDLTPKHVTFICGNVPAKRGMTLQAKEVSPVATTSDAGEKVVASPSGSHDTREKWIDKIRASQKKHLDSVVWDGKEPDELIQVNGRLVIPEQDKELVKEVLSAVHDDPLAGHVGISKMLECLRSHGVYIRHASDHAKKHVDQCPVCQRLRAR